MIHLNKFAKSIYSQSGEDGIIEAIFQHIPCTNTYCEFGAGDGHFVSNTKRLRELGWTGVLIEGSSDADKLKGLAGVTPIKAFISLEPGETLDELLATTNLPAEFDLMSVDIDGNDLWVWDSLKNYRPKCVVIEYNYKYNESLTIFYDRNHRFANNSYYGATARALFKLAATKGYDCVGFTPNHNLFFVDKSYSDKFAIIDIDQVPLGPGWTESGRTMQVY